LVEKAAAFHPGRLPLENMEQLEEIK